MTEGGEPDLEERVGAWIAADPDQETRSELESLLEKHDLTALAELFGAPLTFGTAGIRGPLGAGPARMNRLVVRRTTAGLCRWLHERGDAERGVVVGRDARHGSASFSADTSAVAAVLGVRVQTFSRPLPTPITAFATRYLGAAAGVMITASHNPATDNGYKVYLEDGAQVIPPYDAEIAADSAHGDEDLARAGSKGTPRKVERVDEHELLAAYRSIVLDLLDPDSPRELSIVYTPLHGVGGAITPDLLEEAGFPRPEIVVRQAEPDPDFPTVAFPNPEEPGALDLAFADAERVGADIVLANDPDADRLAVAVALARGGGPRFRALTGDEVGILLADHLIATTSGDDRLVATSIVSSSMLGSLAQARGVAFVETLTGFKWLARAATRRPGHRLLFAYEEALGYAVSDAVADKDGISAAAVVAELAALHKSRGQSLLDRLDDLSAELGVHLTGQWSLRLEGADAPTAMARIVDRWRSTPPTMLAGRDITMHTDLANGSEELPPTDGVIVRSGTSIRVIIRPSGTEPKLKAYLEIRTPPCGKEELAAARHDAAATMTVLRSEVATLCS